MMSTATFSNQLIFLGFFKHSLIFIVLVLFVIYKIATVECENHFVKGLKKYGEEDNMCLSTVYMN